MGDEYRWTDDFYDSLHDAGVDWRDVLHILAVHPRIRHHLGAVLRIAAPARNGDWLAVSAIEEHDNTYTLVRARWLDPDETQAARKMLQGGQ
ncbi:hypothetical protein ABZ541_28975 [Micromonospora sediminicola]|uniref:hypothetical protein n=1 Tax=Micromonospora sediminicola TaxID=946078 RepID=UPI0033C08585